jgi:redox-sensitive bicupin YhaK (pirin superfamily)
MSGPVSSHDTDADRHHDEARPPCVEVIEGRVTDLQGLEVVRLLPRRPRRTVGAWCFADHFGPTSVDVSRMDVGPHPHIGLQTVTWLIDGELLHRDSLGSEQLIVPGQLNLMTAGRGVSHSEETPDDAYGDLHGIQLWVAQPEATRFGEPAFEHHDRLPQVELDGGARATVLVGELAGARSPARHDTPLVGADLVLDVALVTGLNPAFEHALIVLEGRITVDATDVPTGHLAYLGVGRDELDLVVEDHARALLIGGEPFGEDLVMWWNYVARSRDEVAEAHRQWRARDPRFGEVASPLPRIDGPERVI